MSVFVRINRGELGATHLVNVKIYEMGNLLLGLYDMVKHFSVKIISGKRALFVAVAVCQGSLCVETGNKWLHRF